MYLAKSTVKRTVLSLKFKGHMFVEKASPADNPKLTCVSKTSKLVIKVAHLLLLCTSPKPLFPSAEVLGLGREVKSFLLPS